MALLRGFDRFLLFCRVQKAQHTANILICRVPRSSTRQTLTFAVCLTPAYGKGDDVHGRWDRLTGPSLRCVLPQGTRQRWRFVVCWAVGARRMMTALSYSERPLTWTHFAVGCLMGTRRSLDSPCVGHGAHGEVSIRRVLSIRRVFSFRRTAKVLFTVCPRKSTRQTLRHTANSRFPVVFLMKNQNNK